MAWPSRLITCLQAHAPGKEGGNTSQALQRAAAPPCLDWRQHAAATNADMAASQGCCAPHAGQWESCSPEIERKTHRETSALDVSLQATTIRRGGNLEPQRPRCHSYSLRCLTSQLTQHALAHQPQASDAGTFGNNLVRFRADSGGLPFPAVSCLERRL